MRPDASRHWEAAADLLARPNARPWRLVRVLRAVLPPNQRAIYRRLAVAAVCLFDLWVASGAESFLSGLGEIAYFLVCALIGWLSGLLIAWLCDVRRRQRRNSRNQNRAAQAGYRPYVCSLAAQRPVVPAHTALANQRANALLIENLTGRQLRQYTTYGHFEVIGGDSGKRYRIRHGSMQNIEELDALGHCVCIWCFYPAGVVIGDVLLAQKTALELFETDAIRIANRFPVA